MRMDTVGNIEIRVYPDDTKKHKRPHFHAVGPDDNIVVGLPDLDIIEGEIGAAERKQVMRWANEHKDDLINEWNKGNPNIPVRTP